MLATRFRRSFFSILTILLVLVSGLFLYSNYAYASESHGTIDATYYRARICRDVPCTSTAAGTINFRATGVTPITIDDVDGVDGVAWGNDLGWITFDPTGSQEVVVATSTGVLSGYAWAQVGGWINMSPTGYGVTINSQGEFQGYGWVGGANGGWIKFDCSSSGISQNQCVKTDWRPEPVRGGGPGTTTNPGNNGGGGGGSSGGTHYVDVCPNLYGNQPIIPPGYITDLGGMCILVSIDYCPNISGNQQTIPSGLNVNAQGNCVPFAEIPTQSGPDACLNMIGVQTTAPHGFVIDGNNFCIPASTDYCPNIEGNQVYIPSWYQVNERGECIDTTVPVKDPENPDGRDVLALPFIPQSLWQPFDIPWIAEIFEPEESAQEATRPYIDMVSVAVVAVASALGGIILIILVWLFRKNVHGIVTELIGEKPIPGAVIEFISADQGTVKHVISNQQGKYKIRLKTDGHYKIKVYNKNQMASAPAFVSLNKIAKTRIDLGVDSSAVNEQRVVLKKR